MWPVTFCIFSHNRFVRILAIIPAGYIISVVNCLVSAYLCNKIGWPTPKGSWKLHNPPLAQGSKPHDPPPLCFFLGNLPRGGGGVSGTFGVVLGCESGGIAADESGLWNLLYIDNVWLFFFLISRHERKQDWEYLLLSALPSPTGFCLDPIDSNVRKAAPANNTLKHNLSDQSEADKY